MDCWNEAAVEANCDPNTDDECLCGPFFDALTMCTSQTCNIADNLGMCPIKDLRLNNVLTCHAIAALSFLMPACE